MKPALLLYLLLVLLLSSCQSKEEVVAGKEVIEKIVQAEKGDDIAETIICPIEVPCYQLPDEGLMKPLNLNKNYQGLVVLKAAINKGNLNLVYNEIITTRLHYKESEVKYLPDTKELTQLATVLQEYINSIRLKRSSQGACTEIPHYILPIKVN